ncbi:hypothetical protein HaLaN_19881, partial [Haematococcus lacustris]
MVAAADFVIPAYDAGSGVNGLRTASAGAVLLCILNLIWLLCATDKEGRLNMQLPACSCHGRFKRVKPDQAGGNGHQEQQGQPPA